MAEKAVAPAYSAHLEGNTGVGLAPTPAPPLGHYVEGEENAGRSGTTAKRSGAVHVVENPLKVCDQSLLPPHPHSHPHTSHAKASR